MPMVLLLGYCMSNLPVKNNLQFQAASRHHLLPYTTEENAH